MDPQRNPGLTPAQAEAHLRRFLGAERVVWLERGLYGDHTDGHVDNLARFVAPGRVLCAHAARNDDPQRDVLQQVQRELEQAGLEVLTLPSPGRVEGRDGLLPANYLNFYLANARVVVPVYGSDQDGPALDVLRALFPERSVQPVYAKPFLEEGGAVHCLTQPQPAGQGGAAVVGSGP